MPRSIDGIRMWINSNLESGGERGRTIEHANEEVRTLLAEVDRRGNVILNHRKRDELVVAALKREMERGSAVSGGTSLAARILELYEGSPT